MHIVFYASEKPREYLIAKALEEGVASQGDTFEMRRTADYGETLEGEELKYSGPTADTDVACCFGVKSKSRQIIQDHLAVGKSTLFFDKGYTREKGEQGHTLYSRVSVNGGHPLKYMMTRERKPDRWVRLGLKFRKEHMTHNYGGGHILIALSSQKYNDFAGYPDPNRQCDKLVKDIRHIPCSRQIIYRPKPSWRGAVQVPDTALSRPPQTIEEALRGCHAVVTFGATVSLDALLHGVPCICLGDSIAAPICSRTLEEIEKPYWPDKTRRHAWGAQMAYCQWTTPELRSGEAWEDLKEEILRQAKEPKPRKK